MVIFFGIEKAGGLVRGDGGPVLSWMLGNRSRWILRSKTGAMNMAEYAFYQTKVSLPLVLFDFQREKKVFNILLRGTAQGNFLRGQPGGEVGPLRSINLCGRLHKSLLNKPSVESEDRTFLPIGCCWAK